MHVCGVNINTVNIFILAVLRVFFLSLPASASALWVSRAFHSVQDSPPSPGNTS